MAITFICPDKDPKPWIAALINLDPALEIRIWPDDHPRSDIDLALTWAHPSGILKEYPNLGCISSMGAGVDHMLSDSDLPRDVPIVRLVDEHLVRDMAEYLLLAVLCHFRQFDVYQVEQSKRNWHPLDPIAKPDYPIGIMGLGQLGQAAARKLSKEGFPVLGWKNSPGDLPGIYTFHGKNQLSDFLGRVRILICLLPLTPSTRHILNLETFCQLPRNAYLINVGRGGHLKEEDLITALDQGLLSGACLDVFETEPLGTDHPFWTHPRIRITPHVSSQTDVISVAPQVLDNIKRLRSGKPLLNPVNLKKGY